MPATRAASSRTSRLTASVTREDYEDAHWYADVVGYDVSNLLQFMGVRDLVAAARRLKAKVGTRLKTMGRGERMKLLAEEFDRISKAEARRVA